MATRITSWRQRLLGGRPVRAFLKALLLGIALLALLVRFGTHLADIQYIGSSASIILFCAMTFAMWLPLPTGPRWRQLLYEIIAGQPAALLIAWLLFQFILLLTPPARLERLPSGELVWVDAGVIIVLFPTVMLRTLKHAGRYWQQIRRKHLIWELTHGHLVLVILAVMLMAAGVIVALSLVEPGPLIVNLFTRVVGFMTVGSGPFILLLLVILLPSFVLAYSTSRRITRRLQTLTEAIGTLRAGDYRARVQVTGEDEVAQLQSDFNTMADDLERALRELQTERDTVAALLKSRRELFAGVAHDLRTPVATLRGYIESTLERETAALSPVLRQDMEIMDSEVIHLQRLIDDLFTVARTELDRLELEMQVTEIVPLLQRIVKSTSPIAWQKGKVQLVADLPPQLPLVEVDKVRLEQIMNNLLHNGLRHTPPGGVVVVSAGAEQDAVVIQVKDTGEGIAAEDLPRVWEPFYRSADARAKHGSGAGLGLALVKEMTESMGGTVAVESEIGEGSCFTIRLPCSLPER